MHSKNINLLIKCVKLYSPSQTRGSSNLIEYLLVLDLKILTLDGFIQPNSESRLKCEITKNKIIKLKIEKNQQKGLASLGLLLRLYLRPIYLLLIIIYRASTKQIRPNLIYCFNLYNSLKLQECRPKLSSTREPWFFKLIVASLVLI